MMKIFIKKYLKYKTKYLNLKYQGGFFSKKKSKKDKIKAMINLVTAFGPFLNFINNNRGKIELLAKTASMGFTVASLGMGGDTIVELGMLSLEVIGVVTQIVNLLKLFNDDDEVYNNIVKSIIEIQFKGSKDIISRYENFQNIDELEDDEKNILLILSGTHSITFK